MAYKKKKTKQKSLQTRHNVFENRIPEFVFLFPDHLIPFILFAFE